MHANQKIEFQAERDFGSRLNAAFDFIRRNFTPLVISMLVTLMPLLAIGGGILLLIYRYGRADKIDTEISVWFSIWAGLGALVFYFMLLSFLPASIVYSYIKLYRERSESVFTVEQVVSELKKHWLRLLGGGIMSYIVIMPALLLLIVPGIYLAVPMSMIPYIIVNEHVNFFEAFPRAMYMVKNNWWETLGVIIVAGIISSLFTYVFQLPFTIFFGSASLLSASDEFWSLGFWGILSAVVYLVGNFVVQIIPLTIYAFHYHHLVEIKEGTGLMKRLAEFGNTAHPVIDTEDEEETF